MQKIDSNQENATAIVSIPNSKFENTNAIHSELEKYDKLWSELESNFSPQSTLWIISENYYSPERVIPISHEIYKRVVKNSNWTLKNIISVFMYPEGSIEENELVPAYRTVLFFVKDKKYHFDKDKIRLPYVYKGKEWGDRTHGSSGYHNGKKSLRYGGKGRDPGNVFYKEIRDESMRIINILPISIEKLVEDITRVTIPESGTLHTNLDISTNVKTVKNIVKIGL